MDMDLKRVNRQSTFIWVNICARKRPGDDDNEFIVNPFGVWSIAAL
jgi:hypothetical protein